MSSQPYKHVIMSAIWASYVTIYGVFPRNIIPGNFDAQ